MAATSDAKVTRRVYSAEELHRLRSTCSQPKLCEAIEERDGEDAELVKEHVLRGSKSFAARSLRSRTSGNSLRVPSNKENRSTNDADNSRQSSGQHASSTGPVLGEIAPNGQILRSLGPLKFRRSPTPSLKRKKVEAIIKAHGSPQHVRVTAGGRIVPSEQSPLCHPRYGYSAVKTNGGLIKFAPNQPMGNAQWTQATQDGMVAQDVNGRLCQIVNGTILPLNEVDGALRLYVPAPNLNIATARGSSFGVPTQGHFDASGNQQRSMPKRDLVVASEPPLPAQTNALELEYSKREHELRELDKTEALHGRTMNRTAKDALITKRRELVVTLDSIRKAIKSIKTASQPEAPTSPRVMRKQMSVSPPRNRLPAFLQSRAPQGNHMAMPPMPPPYNPFFGMAPPQQANGQYGYQTTPSPDNTYQHPYPMPPPGMFVPPPAFDGSMPNPYPPFPDSAMNGLAAPQGMRAIGAQGLVEGPNVDTRIPQNDGARSVADLQRIGSPRQSHAVDIKAPEPKSAAALKSTLNPMSPAYKPAGVLTGTGGNVERPTARPVKDRAPTPLSPLHQLRPSTATHNTSRATATDDTISPTKKSPHLHSSSVASFDTADFFPRNTREYSTRVWSYRDQTEDKENTSPVLSMHEDTRSPATPPSDPAEARKAKPGVSKAPAPPPGTPVTDDASLEKTQLPIITSVEQKVENFDFAAVPDRQANNLSPKNKRQDFLFLEEHPSQYTTQTSSSSEEHDVVVPAGPVVDQIDFTEASTDWIEGYRAGLARRAVGSDRQGEFLDGYCAGLLKSKPVNIGPSTGSPTKSLARPSSGLVPSRSSSRLRADRRDAMPSRPTLENSIQSFDTLKEGVYAPHNESAVLTPSAEGPHASDARFSLGSRVRAHEQGASTDTLATRTADGVAGYPFPDRTSSMIKRQGILCEKINESKRLNQDSGTAMKANAGPVPTYAELSNKAAHRSGTSSIPATKSTNPGSSGNRISSLTSIDSNLYRQWPGHRVFSPHLEWKSATSIAQAAGLASGFFANAQFDGTAQSQSHDATPANPVMEYASRFKEGSLDGITNPPNSPRAPSFASPPMSPIGSPTLSASPTKKHSSPTKSGSPAKAKFEQIAGKVGIKVSGGNKKKEGASRGSPPGKRGWPSIWRATGAPRREEGVGYPYH